MDPVKNPYAPGAGSPPPELAGRTDIIAKAEISLKRVAAGKPVQSPILVGLRGVGKTVLLIKIQKIADDLFLILLTPPITGFRNCISAWLYRPWSPYSRPRFDSFIASAVFRSCCR